MGIYIVNTRTYIYTYVCVYKYILYTFKQPFEIVYIA